MRDIRRQRWLISKDIILAFIISILSPIVAIITFVTSIIYLPLLFVVTLVWKQFPKPFKYLIDHVEYEGSEVIETYNFPLDNRFGSSQLESEHKFTHTVINKLEICKTKKIEGLLGIKLWSIFEAKAKGQMEKNLGITVNKQVSHEFTHKFKVAPGKFVNYKVIWKQKTRRGTIEFERENQKVQLPYNIKYGLEYSIESISSDS